MLFVFSLKLDVEREIRLEVVGSIVLLGCKNLFRICQFEWIKLR